MLKKIVLLCLLICLASSLSAADSEFLFLAAANVRMRATPSTSADVVATLPLGTRGSITGKTPERQNLLGKDDYWFEIKTDDNKVGWVFGGLTVLFNDSERFAKAVELAASRLELENSTVEEANQLHDFIRKIKEQAPHSLDRGRLELAYLKSIGVAIRAASIAGRRTDSKQKVIVENPGLVYYHECAGEHYVEPAAFWKLSEKFADFPEVSDDMAWCAVNQTEQGETEGIPELVLGFFERSGARYIERFPSGKHLIEAFKSSAETFGYLLENINSEYFDSADEGFRQQFIASLEKLEKSARMAQTSPERENYINALAAVCARVCN